jgi:hypothetical protein
MKKMAEVEKLVGSESPLEVGQKINEIIEKGVGGAGYVMFDTVYKDHVLTYEESKGLALQGTYVYKEALAGSRYGYPDFYNKVVEEFNEATTTETVNSVEVKVHSNGHKYYSIVDKEAIDVFFNTMGSAWFYGVDTENERIFLPRNDYFFQLTGDTSQVNKSVEAGLPNITGSFKVNDSDANGAFYVDSQVSGSNGDAGSSDNHVTFNASRSSAIYGKSNTVQPNAVKKLLYICVGNTTNYEGVTDVVSQGMEILEQVNQGLSDLIPNNRTVWDGQPVLINQSVYTGANSTTLDLFTVVPNDGHIYECVFHAQVSKNKDAGYIQVTYSMNNQRAVSIVTAGMWHDFNNFTFYTQPNNANLSVQVNITSTWATHDVRLLSYRRVGTNE